MLTGSFITAGAIVLSAAIAICISIYHSNWSTKAARTKATFDVLSKKQWDKDYILARSIFINASKSGPNGLLEQISHENDKLLEDQETMSVESAARLIMNDYELTFIAIEDGVLDEALLKSFRRATVIKDYNLTKSYVEWIRGENDNQKIFEIFQRNATKWEKEE